MKYIISESQYKIILEQTEQSNQRAELLNLTNNEGNKAKTHFLKHYSKPETITKFKNKNNISTIKQFIPTIKYTFFSERSGKHGYVKKNSPDIINLNVNNLFTKNGDKITMKGSLLYDTILHEMAHLIDYKMQDLGEKTIENSTGYYSTNDDKDQYVQSDAETFARVQRLRELLDLNPNANGEETKDKLIEFIKTKKMVFPDVRISNIKSPTGLLFVPSKREKGVLTELWRFYSPIKINGTSASDVSALFAKFSSIRPDGSVFLNLDEIGKINVSTKAIPNSSLS